MKKIFLLAALFVAITAYQVLKKETKQDISSPINKGKKLMEEHCYGCHSPTASEQEGRIAPPMVAIKVHYINKSSMTKQEFVKKMVAFIENPTKDKVYLRGAVERFGLMPKQAFPEGAVEKIAEYMFEYQIEEPTWFKAHWESREGDQGWVQSGKKYTEAGYNENNKEKNYTTIGLEYALETKKILGKNLMGAIQKKGTLEALAFCNHQAIPLTDSMSTHFHATIKRVSDKNRNPNNAANKEELKYIEQFKKELAEKKDSQPIVVEKEKYVHFYFPISTNSMCLQCHGKPENITPEVKAKTLKLYPSDKAVGYGENEVRGMWSITFSR